VTLPATPARSARQHLTILNAPADPANPRVVGPRPDDVSRDPTALVFVRAGNAVAPGGTPGAPCPCMTLVHCEPAAAGPRWRMPSPFSAHLVFAVLGPLFLLAGAWRCLGVRRNPVQGRTWLVIGVIFSAVALYLGWSQPDVV
jgi:hypothetical protein